LFCLLIYISGFNEIRFPLNIGSQDCATNDTWASYLDEECGTLAVDSKNDQEYSNNIQCAEKVSDEI